MQHAAQEGAGRQERPRDDAEAGGGGGAPQPEGDTTADQHHRSVRETCRINVETNRINLETNRINLETNRINVETNRINVMPVIRQSLTPYIDTHVHTHSPLGNNWPPLCMNAT